MIWLYLLLAANAGFLIGWVTSAEFHWWSVRKAPRVAGRRDEWTEHKWNLAYDEAMRDWQTCDQLMAESPYPEHQVAGRRDEWGS